MGKFTRVAAKADDPILIKRTHFLYQRSDDSRSAFWRDYNRILHCTAYRRLRHKTQVFFATQHDHICTRIEHVNHVAAISHTISAALGLNTELTAAIAIGHDVGHAPFGHEGESILGKIAQERLGSSFWHEMNSLRFVDKIETLPDPDDKQQNLDLTFAVRDGIVSHCGEVDESFLRPREEPGDLYSIVRESQPAPYTWEACVVKIADKIAYLGRDIEDAITLGILAGEQVLELAKQVRKQTGIDISVNNTVLIHNCIMDMIDNSDPSAGIRMSEKHIAMMKVVKDFNYQHIYRNERLNYFKAYADLIINSLFQVLAGMWQGTASIKVVDEARQQYPTLCGHFGQWLQKYANIVPRDVKYCNAPLYDLTRRVDYDQAVIDFIAGMTDAFAIKLFHELISFDNPY